jgi:aminoglycoside phosphotransferase (APT) family kinase protein
MGLGPKLAEGGSAEVYAWGDGQVIKLFRPAYEHAVDREPQVTSTVHHAGAPSPRVDGIEQVDGRRGIVLERVEGPTLLDLLMARDRSPKRVGADLAELHLTIHEVDAPGLPDLATEAASSGYELPPGDIVFHGDLHPGNVLVAPDRTVAVDWVNAHLAPRAADLACTTMMVRYQALNADQPPEALERERTARARILRSYLDAYLATEPATAAELPFWLTRSARALLRNEHSSADEADVHALAEGRLDDVQEPVVRERCP